MYNLLVMSGGWPPHQSSFTGSRIFEYTEDHIIAAHRNGAMIDFAKLRNYPALFMPEQNSGDNLARVGRIINVSSRYGGDVTIEYSYDNSIPPVDIGWLSTISDDLQINGFEFSRTHWAVKDVDLYRLIIRGISPNMNQATIFHLEDRTAIHPRQMSAMMPFDAGFAKVYATIQAAGAAVGMTVNRADDIWHHTHIIQDIATLISRSRIVVADCTGKNANVFYEIGIAHAIGREVILITQSMNDIPFDLRHLRAIPYLNNGEGLTALQTKIRDRAMTLLNP